MSVHASPRPPAAARSTARRRGQPPPAAAAAAVDVVALAVMLGALAFRRGGGPAYQGTAVLILTAAAWLPLLGRTRWPVPVLAAVTAIECLHLAVLPFVGAYTTAPIAMGAYQPVPVATMVAAWTVASRLRWPVGWTAGGLAAGALLAVSIVAQPGFLIATDMVMFDLVIIATAAGVLVSMRRERTARRAREVREETQRQVTGERLRIARDLHDMVAHHLALVNAQASVAEYLMRNDRKAAAALSGISLHSRQALDELRATVGLLRSDGDNPDDAGPGHSTPGIDKLGELAAGFRSAGTDVSLTAAGVPAELPPGGELAVYRIVQESLTNAAKHAPGAAAAVTLHWRDDRLDLTVTNGAAPGRGPGYRGPGTGHGIIGMGERARTCGGTLTARPAPDAGFEVRASIPVKGSPS
ncbi:MAG: sensor histidine kinase [Trebonia sp.]